MDVCPRLCCVALCRHRPCDELITRPRSTTICQTRFGNQRITRGEGPNLDYRSQLKKIMNEWTDYNSTSCSDYLHSDNNIYIYISQRKYNILHYYVETYLSYSVIIRCYVMIQCSSYFSLSCLDIYCNMAMV
jgi:hypothetical protein